MPSRTVKFKKPGGGTRTVTFKRTKRAGAKKRPASAYAKCVGKKLKAEGLKGKSQKQIQAAFKRVAKSCSRK